MNVYKIVLKGYFEVNSYFLIDEDTAHGFLIDPGAQGDVLAQIIRRKMWTIEKILLTHGHFDHTGGIEELRRELDIPVYIHFSGDDYLKDAQLNLSAYCGEPITIRGANYFSDGDTFTLEGVHHPAFKAIHTPGHTPDSTTFYDESDGIAFVGDTLFRNGPGTDQYPGGNGRQLLNSIRQRIMTLPEDTILYSGHSEPTQVGLERHLYM